MSKTHDEIIEERAISEVLEQVVEALGQIARIQMSAGPSNWTVTNYIRLDETLQAVRSFMPPASEGGEG